MALLYLSNLYYSRDKKGTKESKGESEFDSIKETIDIIALL